MDHQHCGDVSTRTLSNRPAYSRILSSYELDHRIGRQEICPNIPTLFEGNIDDFKRNAVKHNFMCDSGPVEILGLRIMELKYMWT